MHLKCELKCSVCYRNHMANFSVFPENLENFKKHGKVTPKFIVQKRRFRLQDLILTLLTAAKNVRN